MEWYPHVHGVGICVVAVAARTCGVDTALRHKTCSRTFLVAKLNAFNRNPIIQFLIQHLLQCSFVEMNPRTWAGIALGQVNDADHVISHVVEPTPIVFPVHNCVMAGSLVNCVIHDTRYMLLEISKSYPLPFI